MSKKLNEMKAAVAELPSVTQGVINFIEALADCVLANKDDPKALEKLIAEVRADAVNIGNAIAQSTPGAQT